MDKLFRFARAQRRCPEVAAWLAAQEGPLGAAAVRWFERLRSQGDEVRELVHDRYATACFRDAAFAYVAVFKAHVNVGFFRGAALPDPRGLLEGAGKRMRHVKLKRGVASDEAALEQLLRAAHDDMQARLGAG